MDNIFWRSVGLPIAFGILLSFLVERQVLPVTRPFWQRQPGTFGVHTGVWLLLFVLELAAFRRPWLASANVLVIFYILVLVNNAKFESLREPLIFQDVDYCLDLLKHPRLYLPFLGVIRAASGMGAIALVLYCGVIAESTLTGLMRMEDFVVGLASICAVGLLIIYLGGRNALPTTFHPHTDLRELGLIGSLWCYARAERSCRATPSIYERVGARSSGVSVRPSLIAVQSESFFDVRRLCAEIRPEVLQQYDLLKGSAVCHGQLDVPAWGANTVRSEFSFLSAFAPETMGVHQFNPYRKFARHGFPTLASFLKSLGYRTVCVHPYTASFYSRDKVYPRLGFDEFIDVRSFDDSLKSGPFIGDVALAAAVGNLLRETGPQPLFVFVITMENHGPLHLEKVQDGDMQQFYSGTLPDGCDDLTIYLRHLRNADRMAGILREQLETLSNPAWLCWFGDHVPIMPKVYEVMGVPDGRTDYLIWQNGGTRHHKGPLNLGIESLSPLLVQKMGLESLLHSGKMPDSVSHKLEGNGASAM